MANIDQEFEHLKKIPENSLNADIMKYLNDAHSEIQLRDISDPRGPYKKSLIHFAAMGIAPRFCEVCWQSVLPLTNVIGINGHPSLGQQSMVLSTSPKFS